MKPQADKTFFQSTFAEAGDGAIAAFGKTKLSRRKEDVGKILFAKGAWLGC